MSTADTKITTVSLTLEMLEYLKDQIELGYATTISDSIRQCVHEHWAVYKDRGKFGQFDPDETRLPEAPAIPELVTQTPVPEAQVRTATVGSDEYRIVSRADAGDTISIQRLDPRWPGGNVVKAMDLPMPLLHALVRADIAHNGDTDE